MRIGVLSDTHIPDRTCEFPAEIVAIFRGVDLILHAGDVSEQSVLDRLQAVAPVTAVRGNRDRRSLAWLPLQTIVEAGRWRIGLIHGVRSRRAETPDRLRYLIGDHSFLGLRRYVRQAFSAEHVDCIVFGHSHQVCEEWQDGILLFNPGGVVRSPGGEPGSVAILEVGSAGIQALLVPLRNPPRRYTGLEQMKQAMSRRKRQGG